MNIYNNTNEGDLVLDNCAGSGTTGIAAAGLGRNFVLVDQNPEAIQVIEQRFQDQLLTNVKFIELED